MKSFLFALTSTFLCCMTLVGLTSYHFDPFWYHAPSEIEINRRQQKLNLLVSSKYPCQFNHLLFGSSRSNRLRFTTEKYGIFNFSFNDAHPSEYENFLKSYIHICKKEPKKIFIGLDFYSSSTHRFANINIPEFETLYLTANQRIRNQLSLSSLKFIYDFYSNKTTRSLDPNHNEFKFTHKQYYEEVYGQYKFNENNQAIFLNLQSASPNSEFIAFVTPISSLLFEFLIDKGLLNNYHRFIETVANSFSNSYNFMGLNEITQTPSNFDDENHLTRLDAERIFCGLFTTECSYNINNYRLNSTKQN